MQCTLAKSCTIISKCIACNCTVHNFERNDLLIQLVHAMKHICYEKGVIICAANRRLFYAVGCMLEEYFRIYTSRIL